jgi:hypothetical protein
MAVENASRTYMPLEYSFTGRSMNSPISAKSGGGLQNSADNLEQGALAAAVRAHQAEHLAFLQVEADVAQRPKLGVALARAGQHLPQPVGRAAIEAV